jgi:hypothetical protein
MQDLDPALRSRGGKQESERIRGQAWSPRKLFPSATRSTPPPCQAASLFKQSYRLEVHPRAESDDLEEKFGTYLL